MLIYINYQMTGLEIQCEVGWFGGGWFDSVNLMLTIGPNQQLMFGIS